jgi:uncharacterized protein YebE (UPF0316 family)
LLILLAIELLKYAEFFDIIEISLFSFLQNLNNLEIEPVRAATIPFRLQRLVGMRMQTQLKLGAIYCSVYVAAGCNKHLSGFLVTNEVDPH